MAPFKSESQRRLFYAKAKRGEISEDKVREYEEETKANLPEKVKKAKEAKRKAKKYQLGKKMTKNTNEGWSVGNLNRRRSVPAGSTAEIETLKKELAELRAAYARDMENISIDMQTLNSKIQPSAESDTWVKQIYTIFSRLA